MEFGTVGWVSRCPAEGGVDVLPKDSPASAHLLAQAKATLSVVGKQEVSQSGGLSGIRDGDVRADEYVKSVHLPRRVICNFGDRKSKTSQAVLQITMVTTQWVVGLLTSDSWITCNCGHHLVGLLGKTSL